MNIFYLDSCPARAAIYQCDKHVPKMLLETAQMLSTAHRVLDGKKVKQLSKSGRSQTYWVHPDPQLEEVLYKPAHVNHPCSVWIRENSENYKWAFTHFVGLCIEFQFRFNKIHLSETKLRKILQNLPTNIPSAPELTTVPLAMGEEFKGDDAIAAYREFYQSKQERMPMKWERGSSKPEWFR